MNLRNSPISKTPPKWDIPNQIMKGSSPKNTKMEKRPANRYQNNNQNHKHTNGIVDDEQFQMDM